MGHFPINEPILAAARCLNPQKQHNKSGLERVRRLILELLDVIGESHVKRSLGFKNESKYDIIDEIKRQFKEYQTELIPDDFKEPQQKVHSRQNQESYWQKAYKQLQMPLESTDDDKNNCLRVDTFWYKVRMVCEIESFHFLNSKTYIE